MPRFFLLTSTKRGLAFPLSLHRPKATANSEEEERERERGGKETREKGGTSLRLPLFLPSLRSLCTLLRFCALLLALLHWLTHALTHSRGAAKCYTTTCGLGGERKKLSLGRKKEGGRDSCIDSPFSLFYRRGEISLLFFYSERGRRGTSVEEEEESFLPRAGGRADERTERQQEELVDHGVLSTYYACMYLWEGMQTGGGEGRGILQLDWIGWKEGRKEELEAWIHGPARPAEQGHAMPGQPPRLTSINAPCLQANLVSRVTRFAHFHLFILALYVVNSGHSARLPPFSLSASKVSFFFLFFRETCLTPACPRNYSARWVVSPGAVMSLFSAHSGCDDDDDTICL